MIYIASPYSDMSSIVRESRYLKARKYMTKLLKEGKNGISPIVLWHEIAIKERIGVLFEDFKDFDTEFSHYVQKSIYYALKGGKTV